MLSKLLNLISRNKDLKSYQKGIEEINSIYKKLQKKREAFPQDKTSEEFFSTYLKKEGSISDLFACAKLAIFEVTGKELFDSQLIAGLALYENKAIEMKTGEGKTLSAVAAAFANAYKNKKEDGSFGQTFVISTNAYLSNRDFETLSPIYSLLGLTSSCPESQKEASAYKKDIIFMTHSSLGFRYLYDNIAQSLGGQFLPDLSKTFVIIDEADSVLIDDARAPLSVSGPVTNPKDEHIKRAFDVADQLKLGTVIVDRRGKEIGVTGDFYINNNDVHLTAEGSVKIEDLLGVESLYDLDNVFLEHYTTQCLRAIYLKEKDVDYIVRDQKIVLINENTGRPEEGIVLSEGLHQAIEAKEGLELTPEKQSIAKITYQNLFKLFGKISAMSGTIGVESVELEDVYGMKTISIPENKPSQRKDFVDAVFINKEAKLKALIDEIEHIHLSGQPILVGTISVEQSEEISALLYEASIEHKIINAKNHEKEAGILECAGKLDAVTVVTNMAGRGVDIVPSDEAIKVGGLYVLGAERNMTRRYDNQLIGRAGRQGNPGMTRFYVCTEDRVLKVHSGDTVQKILEKTNVSSDIKIESKMVSNLIRKAQNMMDLLYYEQRKNVIAFDDVNRIQRDHINQYRNKILRRDMSILDNLDTYRDEYIKSILLNYYSLNVEQSKATLIENLIKYANIDAKGAIERISDDEFEERAPIVVKEMLMDSFTKRVVNKIPSDQFNDFMLMHFLRIIDENVKDFHAATDMLLSGINLRALNNRSPVEEYKKEAFHLYKSLMTSIRLDYVGFLHKINVKSAEPTEKSEQK